MLKESVSKFRENIIRENNKVNDLLRKVFKNEVVDALYKDMDAILQQMKHVDTGERHVDVVNQYTVKNTGLIKFFNPMDTTISDGKLSVTVNPQRDGLRVPGFVVKQPFSIRYDFDIYRFKIQGYVQKGFYDENSNFIKDEYVSFEFNNYYEKHLSQYREGLHALAHCILHGFPETLTVNVDSLEHQSLTELFDFQSFIPSSFDKLELVGEKTLDGIINRINQYDITSKNDVEYELIKNKMSNISDVLDGVRLMSMNKDKVVDYDSKLERVALVLEDYEQELSKADNKPLDLDNFEVALRVLEQERNMSVKL